MFNNKRYVDSGVLFDHPFKDGEDGHDKIFILARVSDVSASGHKKFIVDVENGMSTYAQNEKVRSALGLSIPILSEVNASEWSKQDELSVTSAGCFVWAVPRDGDPLMLVLKKDAGAGRWTHHYTNPSGRCHRNPRISAFEKCAQKICAVDKGLLLPWARDRRAREELKRYKTEQIASKRRDLENIGCDVDAALNAGPRWMKDRRFPEDSAQRGDVTVRRNGVIISRLDSVVVRWFANENCLDMNRVLSFRAGENIKEEFKAVDGENFGRPVELLTARELLDGRLLMPQLRAYLENRAA